MMGDGRRDPRTICAMPAPYPSAGSVCRGRAESGTPPSIPQGWRPSMSMSLGGRGLALACINIERSKHLSRVGAFLRGHAPDVTCLQEVVADDVDLLGEQVGYPHRFFIPMCRFPEPSGARPIGIAILSRQAFTSSEEIRYAGGGSGGDVLDRSSEEARQPLLGWIGRHRAPRLELHHRHDAFPVV